MHTLQHRESIEIISRTSALYIASCHVTGQHVNVLQFSSVFCCHSFQMYLKPLSIYFSPHLFSSVLVSVFCCAMLLSSLSLTQFWFLRPSCSNSGSWSTNNYIIYKPSKASSDKMQSFSRLVCSCSDGSSMHKNVTIFRVELNIFKFAALSLIFYSRISGCFCFFLDQRFFFLVFIS